MLPASGFSDWVGPSQFMDIDVNSPRKIIERGEPTKPDAKNFRTHVKATLVLGLPLVGAQLAQMGIGVTDTIMIGWLGARELASIVLGTQLFFFVYIFGAGIAIAIVPIAANALGSGDDRAVRRSMRMGLWATMIYCFFALAIMWQSKPIYIFLGQEIENILLAEDYLMIAMWGIFPSLLSMILRSFLTALELARIVLIATLGGVILNIILNYALIFGNFGAPRLEIEGAAWASLGTHTLIVIILVVYILIKQSTRKYEIFTRLWKPDWEAFRDVVKMGLPIGIGVLAEVGLFHAASIMMGWLGTVPLAAHGVALQIAAVTFMIPLGLSNAATVRVGNAHGRQDNRAIAQASYAALLIAIIATLSAAIIIVAMPEFFAGLFLDMKNSDALDVLLYAVPLLMVAAAFQLVDGIQVMMIGALRGIKDIATPTKMAIFSYWIVGAPMAYLLAFPLGLEGVGVWIGLALGLATASALLMWRFWHRERLGLLSP
ncbi:MAG: MATE family efflux transporter [Rhizobiaceae bacterium]|nr:MATE family efflux transporter [Rhizobiaceae bacterium]